MYSGHNGPANPSSGTLPFGSVSLNPRILTNLGAHSHKVLRSRNPPPPPGNGNLRSDSPLYRSQTTTPTGSKGKGREVNGSQGADFLALDLGGPGQEGTGHSEQGFMQMELAQQQGDVGLLFLHSPLLPAADLSVAARARRINISINAAPPSRRSNPPSLNLDRFSPNSRPWSPFRERLSLVSTPTRMRLRPMSAGRRREF